MLIATIENNEIKDILELSVLFPNTSFPISGPSEDFLAENSIMEVVSWIPFNSEIEKLETVSPYIFENKVRTCRIVLKSEEDLLQDLNSKAKEIKARRDLLLKNSDWTQVADAPVDKTIWATYRQSLRDLTQQEGFPFTVVFPNPPL